MNKMPTCLDKCLDQESSKGNRHLKLLYAIIIRKDRFSLDFCKIVNDCFAYVPSITCHFNEK